ncbi:MAG TPA: alkaline phosphatase D family protein [Methylomirabilota bacterium]|nr:alkaline phosphatase D family protein [Methylomirabilota bacterium]
MRLDRRAFLTGGFALGAAHVMAPVARRAGARPRFASTPFTLGVASGYPLPTGVALWTRLAPAPLQPGGGMPREVVPVEWEVAGDERMTAVVQRGAAAAAPEWAHAVHVEVEGLQPARWYWYRFRAGGEVSPVGRTRTAPAANATVDRLRFAFASCQHYEQGYYGAYHRMLADDLDLIVHLGDYIYESSWGRDHVRGHAAPEPHTLEDYRVRHALYKTDPDLQAAHAACPWIVTWDDHEVANDYADDRSQHAHPREWFLARRAAAYQAYYEHLPLRRQMVPFGPHLRLYQQVGFGALASFHVLDNRQFRSHQPCAPPGRGGSTVVEDCAERLDPRLTMHGEAQERWLETGLDRSRARWNVLAQQSIMAQVDRKPGAGRRFWTDSWDGYPVARRRLLDYLGSRKPANPVVIGGDVHSFWVNDLRPDFDEAQSPVVATEIVGTSITSQFGRPEVIDAQRADNPHVRFADGTRRGYVRVEVTPQRLRADLRAMRSVTQPRAEADTLAAFVVEDGRPGAVRA